MQKLSYEVIEKLIQQNATSSQIDGIIYMSRYQDNAGNVKGVYYKDVAEQMCMSNQQFYNMKASLVEKGIISAEKNNYYDHDVTILDNDYSDPKLNLKDKPYVNTNHNIFYTEEFREMKAGAKLMILRLMYLTRMNKASNINPYKRIVEEFFKDMTELLNVSKRVIRSYLTEIKEFFSVGIVKGVYYITPKNKVYKSKEEREGKAGKRTEADQFNEHEIEVVCRRERVQIKSQEELKDTRKVINQYKEKAESKKKNILNVVAEAIRRSVDKGRESVAAVRRELQPKLINTWVQALINDRVATEVTE